MFYDKYRIYLSRETTDFGLLLWILQKSNILAIARVRRIREEDEEDDDDDDGVGEREETDVEEEEDKKGATSKK